MGRYKHEPLQIPITLTIMEPKIVSPLTHGVQQRFFQAIDALIAKSELAGLQTFCNDYGLHRAKYSNLRSAVRDPLHDARYKFVDIDALIYVVRDFKVSPEWLLLGKGNMFKAGR